MNFLLKLVDSAKLDSKKEKKSNQWFLYLPSPPSPPLEFKRSSMVIHLHMWPIQASAWV